MADDPGRARPAPASLSELLDELDRLVDALPRRLKQCAETTRQNLGLVAVSTVSDMAGLSGVAPSAYMRFCQALGFSGYSEMQALFRAEYTQLRPDYGERLAQLRADGTPTTSRLLADFSEAGHESLVELTAALSSERPEAMASTLAGARVVHLVGLRRAYPVVSYMSYVAVGALRQDR